MKKIVSFLILFVIVASLATVVNATSNSELAEKLYEMGKPYGLTSADKVRIERYLSDYPVTSEEADKIIAKAEEAIQVMKDADVTDYTKLTAEQKEQMKSIANEAADILGITLTFTNNGQVKVYKNGKLIETVRLEDGKLAYTGNNTNTILVVSSVAVVALAAGLVARKKFANA